MSPRLGGVDGSMLVIAVQAAALMVFTFTEQEGGYRVANGGGAVPSMGASSWYASRMTPKPPTSRAAEEWKPVVVDGPKPGGVFKVRIATRALGEEEREMTIRSCGKKPISSVCGTSR